MHAQANRVVVQMQNHLQLGRIAFGLLLVASLSFPNTSVAVEPHKGALPDYNAAGGLELIGELPASASRTQLDAVGRLEAVVGGPLRLRANALSGSPRTLTATGAFSAAADGESAEIARSFLQENKAIWGLSAAQVDNLRVDAQYTDRHNGITHIYFTQTADGLAVFGSSLSAHLNARGQVVAVMGDVYPASVAAPAARLSPEEAAEHAAAHVGVKLTAARQRAEKGKTVLAAGPLRSPIEVTEAVYPFFGAPRRAFQMTLEKNGLEWYVVLVDANSGELLYRQNLYVFDGLLTPSNPPEANPATPRGTVFVEHPLSTVRGTGDLVRKYPYTVDATGQPRGFANLPLFGADTPTVIPHGGSPGDGSIPQVLLPLPNASVPLRSNALPLSTSPQSPDGWFIPQGGIYQSIGNNVDAKDDHAADDESSAGLRASGGASGDFSGPQFEFQNNYAQNGPYATNAERFIGATPDLPVAALNLFYISNWYHDFLYHLGFTEAAGNFQLDNFGLGGEDGDYVFADVQDGEGTDNANFGTPSDGANPRMQMFLWSSPERDGDLELDIIVHEYSHGLSNRLVGGPANTLCLGAGLVGESGGMGEGWGDWYATMITDDPVFSEYVDNDHLSGIRRFAVNDGPASFTYGAICTGPDEAPSLVPCEVHDVGEFWAIVLWEMREALINRFHNLAYPGGPTFPTFTAPAGNPDSNIRNAEGRTSDGSGNVAQLDHEVIENATFTALFRVTDGMKFAPCNPTMVDMRDAILAADLASGGHFQDVIWRAFANRGVGAAAFSTGGQAPAVVEDFTVPAGVAACEGLGGPPAAPAFTAVSNSANTVDVTITSNGAAEYVILRSAVGAGSAVDPTPYAEIQRGTNTAFTDTGLDGGFTYYYRVIALHNDECRSAANTVAVTVLGSALPCGDDPAFNGLVGAVDAGNCTALTLVWSPAVSACQTAADISYNVYRSTNSAFTPNAGNRIATGVAGNSYTDASIATGVLYYYVVRAEDSTTGNGGPANDGNEETNAVRKAGMITSGLLVNRSLDDDVESGPDNQRSAHFVSSGFTAAPLPTRGGWFRDDDTTFAAPHSPDFMWHTYDPDNKSVAPSGDAFYALTSDVIEINTASILSFHHTYFMEDAFDGGVVEAALVDDLDIVGAYQDIGHLIFENGYNGVLDAEGSDNVLANRPAFTGGALGPMVRVRAFLGALVPNGEATQRIVFRFVFGSDAANVISVPPVIEGTYFPGWFIDDISVDESCCPLSAAPTNLSATQTGVDEVTLNWQAPGGGGIAEYVIFREAFSDVFPTMFDNAIATVAGTQTTYVDTAAAAGQGYAYVVRARPETGCPSSESNVDAVIVTGPCTTAPFFEGLESVSNPPTVTCTLDLLWDDGGANCPGESVRYNIYRDTNPSFIPGPGNALVLGRSETSYRDQGALVAGTTYYYIVRAEDSTTGNGGPANDGNEDPNLIRISGSPAGPLVPGPSFFDDIEPSAASGYETLSTRTVGGWAVMTDATAHSLNNAWVALDDQPGDPQTTAKDDRLTLPPLHLTDASVLTFWHNFDFARFPLGSPATAFQSGGIVEMSADGETWVDLGPYITAGGYNGAVEPGSVGPLAGRPAWVGSSDAGPNSPVPGRADAMVQVVVDVGAAVSDPDVYDAEQLPGARIRFRLGGTYQILLGGIQGTGWGIDDLAVSNVLADSACGCAFTCGDVDASGGAVDSGDYASFHACIGVYPLETQECTCADLDQDGDVDLHDFALFTRVFNTVSAAEPPECP